MLEPIADSISQYLEQQVSITDCQPLGGGSINQVSRIVLDNGDAYLLKTQSGTVAEDTFQIEYDSLLLLAGANAVRVPAPLVCAEDFLVMEYIQEGRKNGDWQEQLGRQLALQHQHTQQDKFGFHCDNYLGTTPQRNDWHDDWPGFWRDCRLQPQLALFAAGAGRDDVLIRQGEKLLDRLDFLLAGLDEPPVLLHGDLWSGNAMADAKGRPVIFDPACYYGAREAEFGMMRLFGGFGPRCEAAYAEVWPLPAGFEERVNVYRLYHELNHLNLFGQAYYAASLSTLTALL